MRERRRLAVVTLAFALGLSFVVLIAIGTQQPARPTGTEEALALAQGSPGPPGWLHKLAPGERPPQFVLFSFDGAGSHAHWQRILPLARESGAHVTGFLSGVYLLPHIAAETYTGPGHKPGASSIGFGGSAEEVRTRSGDLTTAVQNGHELGTHYNGHFCKGSEPSAGRWTAADWTSELDQFFRFVHEASAYGLHIPAANIKGGRTPCLEGDFEQLLPTLARRGMTYDSSRISNGPTWPTLEHGVWEFRMPTVRVPALDRKVVMMDYNLWYALNKARDEPQRRDEFAAVALDTYRAAFDGVYQGDRAPLVVGNHFNDWAGGAFSSAAEQFMGEACRRPETVCATYSEVIAWMRLQDPAELARITGRQDQPIG
jgi:hypothetical protein